MTPPPAHAPATDDPLAFAPTRLEEVVIRRIWTYPTPPVADASFMIVFAATRHYPKMIAHKNRMRITGHARALRTIRLCIARGLELTLDDDPHVLRFKVRRDG